MNGQSTAELERNLLVEVAREYEQEGYTVLRRPGKGDLPDFLSDFAPGLVAYGADGNVVVEVKARSTLTKSAYLVSLAKVVEAHPGWRLDLVVGNDREGRVVDADAEALNRREVQDRLAAVRQLLASGQEDAAGLLVWSAAEAALRLLAEREAIELGRDAPSFILDQLYSLGVLSREEYDLFREGVRLRNLIVHGYRAPGPKGDVIGKMLNTVEGLLKGEAAHPTEQHGVAVD